MYSLFVPLQGKTFGRRIGGGGGRSHPKPLMLYYLDITQFNMHFLDWTYPTIMEKGHLFTLFLKHLGLV